MTSADRKPVVSKTFPTKNLSYQSITSSGFSKGVTRRRVFLRIGEPRRRSPPSLTLFGYFFDINSFACKARENRDRWHTCTTRRQFLQYCTASAPALALSQTDLLKSEKVRAQNNIVCMRQPYSPQTLHPGDTWHTRVLWPKPHQGRQKKKCHSDGRSTRPTKRSCSSRAARLLPVWCLVSSMSML